VLKKQKEEPYIQKFTNLEVFFADLIILQIYYRGNFDELEKFIELIEVS
jgi:hypothetical protein